MVICTAAIRQCFETPSERVHLNLVSPTERDLKNSAAYFNLATHLDFRSSISLRVLASRSHETPLSSTDHVKRKNNVRNRCGKVSYSHDIQYDLFMLSPSPFVIEVAARLF